MSKGIMRVYYGEGHGKSTAAFGTAIREASHGKTATVISFLKDKNENSEELLKKLEPELKFFRFEKSEVSFDELSEEEKQINKEQIEFALQVQEEITPQKEKGKSKVMNFISNERPTICSAKFRYRQQDISVQVEYIDEKHIKVKYPDKVRAVTPGQACVLYLGEECLGGGIIK